MNFEKIADVTKKCYYSNNTNIILFDFYSRPGRPYIIRSDLTVMPEVTLTIEPGAELEFYPSVGILVLGTLHAQGNIDRNIIMKPVKLSQVRDYRMGKQVQKVRGRFPIKLETQKR